MLRLDTMDLFMMKMGKSLFNNGIILDLLKLICLDGFTGGVYSIVNTIVFNNLNPRFAILYLSVSYEHAGLMDKNVADIFCISYYFYLCGI